jgi:hypothetical protein
VSGKRGPHVMAKPPLSWREALYSWPAGLFWWQRYSHLPEHVWTKEKIFGI